MLLVVLHLCPGKGFLQAVPEDQVPSTVPEPFFCVPWASFQRADEGRKGFTNLSFTNHLFLMDFRDYIPRFQVLSNL